MALKRGAQVGPGIGRTKKTLHVVIKVSYHDHYVISQLVHRKRASLTRAETATRTKDLRKRSASSDPAQERSTIYFWKIFGKFWEIVGEEEGGSSHMAAEGGEKKSSLLVNIPRRL